MNIYHSIDKRTFGLRIDSSLNKPIHLMLSFQWPYKILLKPIELINIIIVYDERRRASFKELVKACNRIWKWMELNTHFHDQCLIFSVQCSFTLRLDDELASTNPFFYRKIWFFRIQMNRDWHSSANDFPFMTFPLTELRMHPEQICQNDSRFYNSMENILSINEHLNSVKMQNSVKIGVDLKNSNRNSKNTTFSLVANWMMHFCVFHKWNRVNMLSIWSLQKNRERKNDTYFANILWIAFKN